MDGTTWPVAGWRAWYAGGRICSARSTTWARLPELGIVVVAVYYAAFTVAGVRYRRFLDGGDWYWPWDRSGTSDARGAWIEPPAHVPPALLKRGVWVSDREFAEISRRAWASRW